MSAYYSEHDPFAAAWLRELIADNLIAPGEVDERDLQDVSPDDIRSFRQVHLCAGVGVWSLAARLAGIPDDAPLWTASFPCQPFSSAGGGAGFDDERHLWPTGHYLIEQCAPPVIVGEQVAGADGDAWLDLVSADMDATGYGFGAAETCAAGFGAPHERSRNYWMAHGLGARLEGLAGHGDDRHQPGRIGAEPLGSTPEGRLLGRVADDDLDGQRAARDARRSESERDAESGGAVCGMEAFRPVRIDRPGPVNGFWRDADWLRCRDESWRPVEPGTFPLADARAFRNRVGLLRGAGNAVAIGQAVGWLKAVKAALSTIR